MSPRHPAMRLGWKVLLAAAAAVVVFTGCTALDHWQRNAIFQNGASARFNTNAPAATEEYDLPLADGDVVRAWYVAAAEPAAPTILFLHGARRNLNGSVARLERLQALGFNVLAIDYRGFGKSTARLPSEASTVEDTLRAFDELKRREPNPHKRFVYGYSLGGALAIELAARVDGLAGVIIESSFTSIADLVRNSKWGWIPGTTLLVTQAFGSIDRIRTVNEPLLFLHGTVDRIVPHAMSDRLAAEAVRAPLKRVVKFEGASHGSTPLVGGVTYDRTVIEFLMQVCNCSRPQPAAQESSPSGWAASIAP